MKKRSQAFYIGLFIFFCALPVVLFAAFGRFSDTTNYENRTLAAMPAFPPADADAAQVWPSEVESCFNDHLPFRNQLVTLNGLIEYRFLHSASSSNVIIGGDGWLFYKGKQSNHEDPPADYQGTDLFSESELQQIAQNLTAARDELAARNIQFVVMFCPNKERIYSEYMPKAYGKLQPGRLQQVTSYLKKNTDLTVVCPVDELMAYKSAHPEQRLYYKYDTHWNNYGSYIGGAAVDEALGFDMPDLSTLTRVEAPLQANDLAKLIHLGQVLTNDDGSMLVGYSPYDVREDVLPEKTELRFNNANGNGDPRKVYIIGDSYSTMMAPYIAGNFNETVMDYYYVYDPSKLDTEKPDIVIYETLERYLWNLTRFSVDQTLPVIPEG
jgi:hypothetical protein